MIFTENPVYAKYKDYLRLVRDCVEGEPAIKNAQTDYLKHPNMLDQSSPQQQRRYQAYIHGAEFHETPSETEAAMLGQMTEGEISYDFPDVLEYLVEDSDGDGIPLSGAVENTFKNVIEAGYHVLLAELSGLTGLDAEQVSVADLKEINPRATIKHYTRESLIDWDFRRINGVMQLSLLVLREIQQERDSTTLVRSDVTTYLVLHLDDDGYYYQQKYVSQIDSKEYIKDGEPHYPRVSNQKLTWIPAEIVFDHEVPAGHLPPRLGYLYRICAQALYRYGVSADYKEALRMIQPTTFTSGWTEQGFEQFEKFNGRDYIAFGAGVSNNLPENVDVDVKGMGVQDEPFERYFDRNEKLTRAMGGVIGEDEQSAALTATEARIDNSKSTAVMKSIIKNTERAMIRMVAYCGMYMGLWDQYSIEDNIDQITLKLPRDFGQPRMTVDEIVAAVNATLISKKEGTRQLVAAGKTIEEAETILDEIENQGPEIGALPLPGQPNRVPVAQETE